MKNAKEMMSFFSLVNGLKSNRTSATPNKSALVLALLSVLMLGSAVSSQDQQKKTTTYVPPAAPRTSTPAPRPAPPAPRPAQSQSSPPPQRHVDPPPQRQTPPPAPAQRQTSPAPQHQTPSVQQHQAPAAPQRQTSPAQQNQAPARTAPTASHPSQPAASASQAQRGSASNQQKAQAAQQKEQVKQQQKQQKEQARQQKEQTKQQQKQQKEQARQQKEEVKRQQKQQARQQKEPQNPRQATSTPPASSRSANPAAATATATKPPRSRSAAAPVYKAPESSAIAAKTATGAMTLTKTGSQATLQQVNSARSNLSGINRKPLPSGDVTVHPNGRLTVAAAGGRKYNVRSNGTVASYRDREKAVNFDSRGKVSSLRTANLSVRRAPNGVRTIETRRADNSRVVTTGRHSGFVERNVVVGNRTYFQRTTIVNQRITTNTFVAYNYRGVALTHFVSPVFYAPAFYGWAYYPWVAPVHFGFGWFGASWYVAPNPFFTAYPVYPSAAFWLTDYMLGETLATAYQLHQDALASKAAGAEFSADAGAIDEGDQSDMLQADATTPVTQELKDQIAEEVKQQIEYDNFTASSPTHETSYDELPAVLGQANHVFIVSSNLDVTTDDQQECGLQAGDLLRLVNPPANDAAIVELRVASSKQMDCPAGVMIGVSLQDLQEMQNSFRSQVESGLASLTASQGHGGIPVAPPNPVAAPPRPELSALPPVSATELSATLEEQRLQADQAEAQAMASSF